MSSQPELTLEKLAACDKCPNCNGEGFDPEKLPRKPGPWTEENRCPKCYGYGRAQISNHPREIYAFLAREIIKTNKRLDKVADDASHGSSYASSMEPMF